MINLIIYGAICIVLIISVVNIVREVYKNEE